jgi:hypothetical protein
VSGLIAGQTGLWAARDRARPLEDYYTGLGPLPTEASGISSGRSGRISLRWQPSSAPAETGGVLELRYRDLFLAERNTRWRLAGSL